MITEYTMEIFYWKPLSTLKIWDILKVSEGLIWIFALFEFWWYLTSSNSRNLNQLVFIFLS